MMTPSLRERELQILQDDCCENRHLQTVRYYLQQKTAEMECLGCFEKTYRAMTDIELMTYMGCDKILVDICPSPERGAKAL